MPQVRWKYKRVSKYEILLVVFLILVTVTDTKKRKKRIYGKHRTTLKVPPKDNTLCMQLDTTLRAKHKSCFLRPDTGPCRADIVQWYFDVKQRRCYRFFWGGCQGNGNRFESKSSCYNYCYLNVTTAQAKIPHFCSLSFDFGDCFGHYNRWYWDNLSKTCKHRIYSGCGGNQNNFESRHECLATCLTAPNDTLSSFRQFTTCIPFQVPERL